jgi:phage protein D
VLDTINQVAETDARLLRRLAAREGFVFLVDDAGFHFRRRNHATAPTHVLTWYADPGRGDLISVNVESDLVRRVGRVEVRGRDPMAKTTVVAQATATSVDRSTLGEVIEVVDPESGGTTLQQRNATASVHPTSASTAGHAKREANARFQGAERDTVKLSAQAVGDPTLRAKTVIEVRGISSLLSGKYYVSEAKHLVTSASYVVELKLTRDGVGRRRLSNAKVQPQGGDPNRHVVPTVGALHEVEIVDPERGGTQIQYRPGATPPGAADPEAHRSKPP